MHSSPFRLLSFAFSPQSSNVHRRHVHHLMVFLLVTILLAAGLASTRATLHDSHKKQDFCSGFPQNILTIGSIDKQLFVIAKDSSVYELKPCDGTNECMNVGRPVPLATFSNGRVWEQIVKAINEKHDVMNNSVILEYRHNATLLIPDGNKTIFYLFSSDGIGYPNATLDCKSKDICNGKFVWISNGMPFILSDDRKKMSQFKMGVEDNNTKVSLDLCKESQRNICMTKDNDSSVTFTVAKCSKNTEVNWTAVEKGLAYQGNFYFFEAKQVRIVAMSSYNTSESAKVNSVSYDRFLKCSKEPVPSTTSTLAPTITQPDPATATATATDDITSSSTSSTNMSSSMSSQFTTDQTMSTDNLTTITIDESTSEASNWTLVIVLSLVIVIVLIIILIGVIVYCYFYSTTAKPKCNNSKAKPKEKQDSTKKVHSTLEVKDGGSDVSKMDSFGALRSDILLEEDIAVPSKSDMDSLATSMAVGAPASTKQAKPAVKKQSKQTFANSKQTIAGGNESKHRAISPKTAISHKNRAHEPDSARFSVKNSRSKSGTMPVATTLATQPAMSIRSSD